MNTKHISSCSPLLLLFPKTGGLNLTSLISYLSKHKCATFYLKIILRFCIYPKCLLLLLIIISIDIQNSALLFTKRKIIKEQSVCFSSVIKKNYKMYTKVNVLVYSDLFAYNFRRYKETKCQVSA
jgi:hypothetical protein